MGRRSGWCDDSAHRDRDCACAYVRVCMSACVFVFACVRVLVCACVGVASALNAGCSVTVAHAGTSASSACGRQPRSSTVVRTGESGDGRGVGSNCEER